MILGNRNSRYTAVVFRFNIKTQHRDVGPSIGSTQIRLQVWLLFTNQCPFVMRIEWNSFTEYYGVQQMLPFYEFWNSFVSSV